MQDIILRTKGLSKQYGDQNAVDHVDMTIRRGQIYGFIGRNGAGKTTLIRMVTGLIQKTSGHIELFGKADDVGLRKARGKIGAVVEAPALLPGMTAMENIEYQRLLHDGRGDIKKSLSLAGLGDTGKKKVRDFSLGMKQRLGLAMTLLHEPEFILLDEPTNGLDPAEIIEMRETLKELARQTGTTILISSHILAELSQLSTHYGIIHKGKLVRQLSADELQRECTQYLSIKMSNVQKGVSILEKSFPALNYQTGPQGEIRLFHLNDKAAQINRTLIESGIDVRELHSAGQDLESYFLAVTGGAIND